MDTLICTGFQHQLNILQTADTPRPPSAGYLSRMKTFLNPFQPGLSISSVCSNVQHGKPHPPLPLIQAGIFNRVTGIFQTHEN